MSSSTSATQDRDSGRGGGDSAASVCGITVATEEALFLLGAPLLIAGEFVSPSSS